MDEEKENKNIEVDFSKATQQHILYKLAQSCKDIYGRSFLKDYEITMMLLARLGQEPLKKVWGIGTYEKIQELKILGGLISKINFYLLGVKEIERMDDYNPNLLKAMESYKEVVENLDLLYEAFYILWDATPNLKYMDIPHHYLSDEPKHKSEDGEKL